MAFIVHRTVRPAAKFYWAYSIVLCTFLHGFHVTIANSTCDAICHFRDEKGPGAEISDAIASGIVTGDTPVSYWSIFFFVPLATVPEGFAKANSTQSTFHFLSGKFVGLTKLLLKLHSMTCELNVHKEL